MRAFATMAVLAAALALAPPAAAADPESGQKIFKTQCGACHAVAAGRNLVGPSQFGIVGRKSGSVEGFRYSAANKAANLTWDAATLDTYLTNPKAMIPGTTMTFAGIKSAEQRADVIAYLATLK
ncbi:MAG: cytochrome c family protein [Alphaproteobacteria bacterium]|nr:cytochrome c family protein [Alphaproteobacteria bacterium]